MIRYKHDTTEEQFYEFYLKLHSITQNNSDKILTNREVELTTQLLLSENSDPFHGKEREKIMKKLRIGTANFSVLIRSLVRKGILIKIDKQQYEFAYPIKSIKRLYLNHLINPLEIVFEFKKTDNDEL